MGGVDRAGQQAQGGRPGSSRIDADTRVLSAPTISLPKGGGAIRGIGEKFGANPVTGTASMTVPIAVSPGRSAFGPQLALSYDSGAGNGPFGFGWVLSLTAITRKTDKGLPQYHDDVESDVFILSDAEDLVPVLGDVEGELRRHRIERTVADVRYRVQRYRPRIEGLFARIERWTDLATGLIHWRSISRDNVTTFYGRTPNSRIADPCDPSRCFKWLICESYDDKGNALAYEYKAEDDVGVDVSLAHERNRRSVDRSANRYLKRIKYGNRVPHYAGDDLSKQEWMFEVVFDYGDHGPDAPVPADNQSWILRPDEFSSYRAGFEVRTSRLCQRVLMFHHFPNETGVGRDCLVSATTFTYRSGPVASFISAVTRSGYKRAGGGYISRSIPPLEFEYSVPVVHDAVKTLDRASLENLPAGLIEQYQWMDVDGEGLSGILSQQATALFYKRNLGGGRFGATEVLRSEPSLASLSGRFSQQLLDLAGDGQLDLVLLAGPTPGFYERKREGGWETFKTFARLPNLQWDDPNLRFVDLDGDGHADVLITQEDVLTWYPSAAEEGFSEARRVHLPFDDESGPRLVFADEHQSVFLADMSGDGPTDLVRIRNGEVCYWPNLGYGRFGAKVTMTNSPWFDTPGLFDQKRVRLADIDGSGTNDLIYVGSTGVTLYFNQSGNRWSAPYRLEQFPPTDRLSSVAAVDLLGNGTACLVWSSPLPGDAVAPLRYVDLMGSEKPHLLVRIVNNLGAETRIHYAPSTKFYVADREAGHPWVTRLPFPVHVVERVETFDHISRNRFVTRYAYHHGFYDGVEREFRGFGCVDQWDTEEFATLTASGELPAGDNVDASSHVPPIWTKTWFHTGAYLDGRSISLQFVSEYYKEEGLPEEQHDAMLLEDTVLPKGLSYDEAREATRALKGSVLRQEIYGLDGSPNQTHPYIVSERNYSIRRLQTAGPNHHAIFITAGQETLDFHYEREPSDPRIVHTLALEVDEFATILKEVSVGYGRRRPDRDLASADQAKQLVTLITYTEHQITNHQDGDDTYRTPLRCGTRTYELTGYSPTGPAGRFQVTDFVRLDQRGRHRPTHVFDEEIPYETVSTTGRQRRLIHEARTLYRPDDLGTAAGDRMALLPFGTSESMALAGETYNLAFTPGLLRQVFGALVHGSTRAIVSDNPGEVLGGTGADQGGYRELDADGRWWLPTGRAFLSPVPTDSPADELAFAKRHFYLPLRYEDAFNHAVYVEYDQYDLLLAGRRDEAGNQVTAGERDLSGTLQSGLDYRVLQPRLLMDANRNRVAAAFDALGSVAGTAAMGKPEETQGDTLEGFESDLSEAEIMEHASNPLADPHRILRRATNRVVYDLFAFLRTKGSADPAPPVVYALSREVHDAELTDEAHSRVQHAFSYSDGFGREVQKKVQVEPDTADNAIPRWVGTGWTIFNNKGAPVQQYEPFFSATHSFEFARTSGVSPIVFYDPPGRLVGSVHPDHAWEKIVFSPWRQQKWDLNDTVHIVDPRHDIHVGRLFTRLRQESYLPAWRVQRERGDLGTEEQAAAHKALVHAETPTTMHADSLGRTFLTIVHNRWKQDLQSAETALRDEFHVTRTVFDIEGHQRQIIDATDRSIVRLDYDLLGNVLHTSSMDGGERWVIADVMGNPIRAWDTRGREFRNCYDALRRPTDSYVRGPAATETLIGRIVYGDSYPEPEIQNLRAQVAQRFDQAGIVFSEEFDFKGNLQRSRRQLTLEYREGINWSGPTPLEEHFYESVTRYDALNRPIELRAPDRSVIRPRYNEANLLERLDVNLQGHVVEGNPVWTAFILGIEYDQKGQRKKVEFGNGVTTRYEFDRLTFRLTSLVTSRNASAFPDDCPAPPDQSGHDCHIQNLHYTYDAVGNITSIRDAAQQTVFFRNQQIKGSIEYTYDSAYRLISATGREHLSRRDKWGLDDTNAAWFADVQHPGDGRALARFVEHYWYDAVGNLLEMRHRINDPSHSSWARIYSYLEPSHLEPATHSNRLSSTSVGADSEIYSYDRHGNMSRMSHLRRMEWDHRDQLHQSVRQVVNDGGIPETTWYVYDADGQRVRKITDKQAAPGERPARKTERIYLPGFELYREYEGERTTLERQTLHIVDDQQRIAIVESRTVGEEPGPAQLIRYQVGNHLGSATIELSAEAEVISYEEFLPFGGTALLLLGTATRSRRKRFRFAGKERDEENGLSYHGARYLAPWLGRWTSPDPAGFVDGPNLYVFTRNNPVMHSDSSGAFCDPSTQSCVDPTVPTAREEALQQSLPEDERHLPAASLLESTVSPSTETGTTSLFTTTTTGTFELTLVPFEGEPLDDVELYIVPDSGDESSFIVDSLPYGGAGLIFAHPAGPTLTVPDTYTFDKLQRYQVEVRRGTIGRSPVPTSQIRVLPAQRAGVAEFYRLARAQGTFPQGVAPGGRGWAADHIIELQHDLTGRSGTRASHYRWQDSLSNSLEGNRSYQLQRNVPRGTQYGAVATESAATGWRYSPQTRTAARWGGRALLVYGVYQSGSNVYGAYQQDVASGDGSYTRTTRAVTTEAGGWGAALALGKAGALAGGFCGPAAWICSPVGGLVGGGLGYFGGSALVDWMWE